MLLFYIFFNPKNIRKTFKKNMILLNKMVFYLYMLLGSKITRRSKKEYYKVQNKMKKYLY